MIVEGDKIPDAVVEQFTAKVLQQREPFRSGEAVRLAKSLHEFTGEYTPNRFVDRVLQKLRKAGKTHFGAGYWSVLG